MTILIAGEIDFPPENREAALTGAKALIDMALAESGCQHYAWTIDPHLPGRVHVFEQWDSAAELQAHLEGAAYTGMLAHLSGYSILGAVTRKYRCDLIEPVYGPDGVATARFLSAGNDVMANLKSKVAVVLGAASPGNMGQHIAIALADAGAKVVVAGRKQDELQRLAATIGGDWMLCDITAKAEVEALAAETVARHGRADIAINATGWGLLKSMHEISEEELEGIVALQFKGVHHFLGAFVRAMPNGGSIVQISSATTQCVIDDHAAYIGTKAGSEALIRCVASQYGPQGIRANTLSPGFTESPMTSASFAVPGLADAFVKEYPLGRLGTVQDIAAAAVWLCSDDCFMTGQNLQINGGLTLRRNPRGDEIAASIGAAMAATQGGGLQ